MRCSHPSCSLLLYLQHLQIHINSNLVLWPTYLQPLPASQVHQCTNIIPSSGCWDLQADLNSLQLSWETLWAAGEWCALKGREDSPPLVMLCPAGCGQSPSSIPETAPFGSLCCYCQALHHSHCKRIRINCPVLQCLKYMPGIFSSANRTFSDTSASHEGYPSFSPEAHHLRKPPRQILCAGLTHL